MKFLSLDISSTCTGYTKYELWEGELRHLETGSIRPKGVDMYTRLVNLNKTMEEMGFYTWPDYCIIEGFAFAGSKVVQMAEVNGVVKYNLTLNKVPFDTISPMTVKKQVTGYGRSKKEQVAEHLKRYTFLSDVTFKNEDESDSAAIGLAYLMKHYRLKPEKMEVPDAGTD